MNGSSNWVRLPVADRKVDTGGDLLVGHGFADEERVGRRWNHTCQLGWAGDALKLVKVGQRTVKYTTYYIHC